MKDRILDVIMAALIVMIIISAFYILALLGEPQSFWLMKLIGLM